MRALVIIAMVAATVAAEPTRSPWSEWVGSYRGALTWSGCTIAGAKAPMLALDFVDGVATIDLAPARPGLRSMTLIEADHGGWSGRQGDVAVELRRVRDAIQLAVDIEGGCLVRGRLTKPSTGVAACDRLLGWARIEATCTKQAAPVEDLAKLLATAWKPVDRNRCTQRAASLEHALIDAGCAPHPDPTIGVRSPECLDLAQQAARISRCANVLPDLKTLAVDAAHALVSASQTAERSTLPAVAQQCRDARAELIAIATKFRCP